METLQSLAVESFSYSWLSNVKPSFDSLDESPRASLDSFHEATFADLDYKIVKSQRFQGESQNFNFDIPISPSPAPFLHADELFSDGLIKPVYVDPSKIETSHTSDPVTVPPVSSFSSRNIIAAHQVHYHFFRKLRKSSKRVLKKCFGYIIPFCHKVGSSRKSNRVDDIDWRVWEVKSRSNSPQASPQRHTAYSVGDWSDIESSIYEAILHCKRSIEK
ncbi:hypothetical protein LWI29_032369 [Acer saccharum]|uniref:Membrane-associated kinase regulator 6 n=1 Tax=Acer saccharum TaxID=4024 RepID=A0AA39RXY9_ACESA|nr:hypothetical protein LWI29_032369 [Acer saccharum]